MSVQCNTKLLLLIALIPIAIILTGTLVPVILHEQKKAFYWRLFLQSQQSQHIDAPITVIQGDTVYLNASNNPCNYSIFWYHGNCELCGWNGYLHNFTEYHTNTSCSPKFICINETKGLQLHNVTLNDSGTYTEDVYECDLLCNITNCTYTINSTKYIITVLSPHHSKHTNSHVSTHVGWTAAVVMVIIICVLIYFNVPTTLRHKLQTRNNVNHVT